MGALFVASFSLTLVLQQQAEKSAITPAYSAPAVLVPQPIAGSGLGEGDLPMNSEDGAPQTEQWDPTLYELAIDPDPGTQAEAQTLLGLLNEENSID